MELTATYDSGDLVLEFTATGITTDYGVRDSAHIEVHYIELYSVEIAGQSLDPRDLPKSLVDALMGYADECEFEQA